MGKTTNIVEDTYNIKLLKYKNYTIEQAENDILKAKTFIKKINNFNKEIEQVELDKNGIPKIIHFTCKDKNNLNNKIWEECLNKYRSMYSDYKLIIYDNNDIYNIIEIFDKPNLEAIKSIKIGAVLADVFRYYILYLRGGYYSDLDCEPIKHIENLSELQYHGQSENNFFIYPPNKKITYKQWDFHDNPCDNCVFQNKNKHKVDIYKCLGHNYVKDETNIILCYEFEKTWHKDLINNEKINSSWVDNNIGICQWFIGSKPRQKLFLCCYKECMKNIKYLQNLNKDNDKNYHYNVINGCGPLFFTKVINKFLEKYKEFNNKVCILPSDYFCCGSFDKVPQSKNTFIKHRFTGSWLK